MIGIMPLTSPRQNCRLQATGLATAKRSGIEARKISLGDDRFLPLLVESKIGLLSKLAKSLMVLLVGGGWLLAATEKGSAGGTAESASAELKSAKKPLELLLVLKAFCDTKTKSQA